MTRLSNRGVAAAAYQCKWQAMLSINENNRNGMAAASVSYGIVISNQQQQ